MNKLKNYSDEMLIRLLVDQDWSAFNEIYNRYWSKLYAVAYRRLRSREASEELVQDIFTSLWINRNIASMQNLSAYLFTAIKYKVINHIQKEIVKRNYSEIKIKSKPVLVNTTEEYVYYNDLNLAVERAIDQLPAKCRNVFKLSRHGNLSMKQVACQLDISEKTVENHLGKAIRILRLKLKDFVLFMLMISLSL
jgi:RNA polymerase sigma-70 factor (family 1)